MNIDQTAPMGAWKQILIFENLRPDFPGKITVWLATGTQNPNRAIIKPNGSALHAAGWKGKITANLLAARMLYRLLLGEH